MITRFNSKKSLSNFIINDLIFYHSQQPLTSPNDRLTDRMTRPPPPPPSPPLCAYADRSAPTRPRAQWPLFVFKSKVACLYNCPPTQSLLIVFLREHRQSIPHFKNYYYMLLWHQIIMNKQLQMKKKIILCPFHCCLNVCFKKKLDKL